MLRDFKRSLMRGVAAIGITAGCINERNYPDPKARVYPRKDKP